MIESKPKVGRRWKLRLANGRMIKGNGALPEIWVLNESSEDGNKESSDGSGARERGGGGGGGGGGGIFVYERSSPHNLQEAKVLLYSIWKSHCDRNFVINYLKIQKITNTWRLLILKQLSLNYVTQKVA